MTIENIENRDREEVETFFDSNLFNLIDFFKEKLSSIVSCKDKIKMLFKYARSKIFITKLRNHFRGASKLTDFQDSFRNRIIFAKLFDYYTFDHKKIKGKIVFMLIVESLIEIPRPYIFRIFTIEKCEGTLEIDIKKKIFNK